jgi:hypothetical protein
MKRLRLAIIFGVTAIVCGIAGHFESRILNKASILISDVRILIPDEGPPTIKISSYDSAPDQLGRFESAAIKSPLVVDLHQWSTNESGYIGDDERFDLAVKHMGWNFIRPALAGPNNNPASCCSDIVLSGIEAAIQ